MKVVTICGSLKFENGMKEVAKRLTLENRFCVLQCVYLDKLQKLQQTDLDNLRSAHFKKIDISDAIYVVNIGGYIGESTRNEIEYAKAHNKEVIYHEKVAENVK